MEPMSCLGLVSRKRFRWSFEVFEADIGMKLVENLRNGLKSPLVLRFRVSHGRFQPNIADNILREAPFLAETLLDGLIWRSHKSQELLESLG